MDQFYGFISALKQDKSKDKIFRYDLLKKAWKLSSKYWKKLIFLVVCLAISAAVEIIPSLIIKILLDKGLVAILNIENF